MATYKQIFGKQVKFLSSDPANQAEGQVWYNSTSGTFKSVVVSEAWSSGANTINLTNGGGAAGTQTAGLIFGGRNPNVPAFVSTAEEYNGSGWSATGALNTARAYIAGFGVQTAAVGAGGRIDAPGTLTAATEEYDGSTWTTNPSPSGDMGSARKMQNGGVGILTAGLGVGPSATEEYGGTTWTAGGALNTTRNYLAAFGTQTAAAAAGGGTPPYSSAVEEYNGTSWTTSPGSLPAIRQSAAAAGTQTDGLIFGGELSGAVATNTAFSYDGSTWSAKPNMANSGFSGMGQGTGTAALASNFRGAPGVTRNTELFNRSANVVTAAAWASGGAMSLGRYNGFGYGTQDAAVASSNDGTYVTTTEEYDGASWTGGGALNTGRGGGRAGGTQAAGIVFAGYTGSNSTATETYNGTAYATSPATMATGRRNLASSTNSPAPTATAFGGYVTASSAVTEEFNGTAWATSPGSMSTARYKLGGAGTQTAALAFGGIPAPGGTPQSITEEYNGASWTAGGALGAAVDQITGTGLSTAALAIGGSPALTTTQGYDGTAWSTRPALGTGRGYMMGCGTGTSALGIGGQAPPSGTTATEEFTGETTAANIVTVTTS